MAAPTSPTQTELERYPYNVTLARLAEQIRRWETELGGTPPAEPTTSQMQFMGESAVLAVIVDGLRRCETATGGTAPVSPTMAAMQWKGRHGLLALVVEQCRRLETALGGTSDTSPTISELSARSYRELLAWVVDGLRSAEAAAGGTAPTSPTRTELGRRPHGVILAEAIRQGRRNEENALAFDAIAQTYREALEAAGYTLSSARTRAFSDYVNSGQVDGWWDKLVAIYPFEGDALDEVIIALKGANLTNSGYLVGDILANGGISGRASAWFDTGVGLNELPVTGQYGIGIWLTETVATTNEQRIMGTFSGANDLRLYQQSGSQNIRADADGALTKTVPFTAGLWRASRASNVLAELSHNSVVLNRYTTTTTPASIADNIFIGTAGGSGALGLITDYGFAFIDDGTMTAAQELAHFTALCRLMDDLGRLTRLSGTLPLLLVNGQSLANGSDSTPALTTAQPYTSKMRVGTSTFGVRATDELFTQATLLTVVGTDAGGATNAVEVSQESPTCAMGAQLGGMRRDAGGSHEYDPFLVCVGYPGGSYAQLKKNGSIPGNYQQSVDHVAAFTRMAPLLRKGGFGEAMIATVHGQANALDPFYYSYMAEWHSDFLSDISASTGQATLAMLCSQDSSWSKSSLTSSIVQFEQLRRHNTDSTKHLLVCPMYFLTHAATGIHLTNSSSRLLGEYYGKAAYTFKTTGAWTPLKPDAANISLSGSTITIPMLGAVGALVLDTTLVTQLADGNYGFEFIDSTPGGSPTITNVAISGSNVVITLSAAPTGPGMRIRYAYTGVSGQNGGPTTGPRGCLRDSDTTEGDQSGDPLYNWCVHFDHQVPNASGWLWGSIAAERKLWLRPEELSGGENDPIGTWQDVSGWRNSATQATTAKKPILKLADANFNGKNCLSFDGGDDEMVNGFTQSNNNCGGTTFVVVRAASGNESYATFYGRGGGQAFYQNLAGSTWGTWTTAARDTTDTLVNTTAICTNSYDRITNSGGTTKLYTNGTLRVTTATGISGASPYIGAGGASYRTCNCSIAEILDFDRLLTDTERSAVTAYLGTKYNITVA